MNPNGKQTMSASTDPACLDKKLNTVEAIKCSFQHHLKYSLAKDEFSATDHDRYYALASAFYAELLLAGYTAVGEFHYLHRDSTTAMSDAVIAAARDAGIRLTLLDTLYRHGGLDAAGVAQVPRGAQKLFISDIDGWMTRHESLVFSGNSRRGAALHSLRAVDPDDVARVVEATGDEPLHAHVSEQPDENQQVEFDVAPGRKGEEAQNVRVV